MMTDDSFETVVIRYSHPEMVVLLSMLAFAASPPAVPLGRRMKRAFC